MNQKLTEELQIVGLGLLIVAISMSSILGYDFRDKWILILGVSGMVLLSIGYTVSWVRKGVRSFLFWQNLISYMLFLIFILGLYYDLGEWNDWVLYALAISSAIGAGYHLAGRIKEYAGDMRSLLSLSNLLMVASLVFIISGVILNGQSENASKLLLTGVFLFIAWGIAMRREGAEKPDQDGDEDL